MTSLNDQKNKLNFLKNSAMLVKETPVTLVTITQLCNVQKDLVNPSNKFPINYKRSCLQCIRTSKESQQLGSASACDEVSEAAGESSPTAE